VNAPVALHDRERRERRRLGARDDVHDVNSACEQVIRDDAAVASPPHRLRAHDRFHAGDREQLIQARAELRGQRVVGEVPERRHAPRVVRERRRLLRHAAAAAERRDRGVCDAVLGK
jgi:hypothetical protein